MKDSAAALRGGVNSNTWFLLQSGQWKDNRASGRGIFYHADGDKYEGEWRDSKANGKGNYYHFNGATYEGIDWSTNTPFAS